MWFTCDKTLMVEAAGIRALLLTAKPSVEVPVWNIILLGGPL